MFKNKNFYSDKVVYKPWGYEYVIYNDRKKTAITFVCINYGRKTSLHCHPEKKTGFIILGGKALVQVGIYEENTKVFNSLSRLVFRSGLFHSLKALSKSGVYALEIEAPYKKQSLVRLKDSYGRQSKNYEGKKHTKKISDTNFIKFVKPRLEEKKEYLFNNIRVVVQTTSNLKKLLNKNDQSTTAILDGSIVDNKNQKVISQGEVVKTKTLNILAKKFKIKNKITTMTVLKSKYKNRKQNFFTHES